MNTNCPLCKEPLPINLLCPNCETSFEEAKQIEDAFATIDPMHYDAPGVEVIEE